jgi:hypothetical protein
MPKYSVTFNNSSRYVVSARGPIQAVKAAEAAMGFGEAADPGLQGDAPLLISVVPISSRRHDATEALGKH